MPDNETLSAAAFFVAALIAGLWGYFKKPAVPPASASGTVMTAAIGMGWLERDQAERLLAGVDAQTKAQSRMAAALEALADKRANEMRDTIEELMEVMRRNEERLRSVEGMRTRRR